MLEGEEGDMSSIYMVFQGDKPSQEEIEVIIKKARDIMFGLPFKTVLGSSKDI